MELSPVSRWHPTRASLWIHLYLINGFTTLPPVVSFLHLRWIAVLRSSVTKSILSPRACACKKLCVGVEAQVPGLMDTSSKAGGRSCDVKSGLRITGSRSHVPRREHGFKKGLERWHLTVSGEAAHTPHRPRRRVVSPAAGRGATMDDFVDAAASYPTLSQQLQHDEKVYAMLKSRGYECSSVLIRKRYCALYRGKRTSNGAGVLLKTYESKLRMQRSREFLNLLAGTGTYISQLLSNLLRTTGTAPEILEYVEDDSFMVFADLGGTRVFCECAAHCSGITGESLLEEDASPKLRQDTSGFIQLAITLAHSLNILHSRRVIHGSISPANFMYVPDGASGGYRAILLEFHGALKFDEENSETHAIWQRQPLAYISPEQTGQVAMRTDYRCDLYSLGVVLYQLCAGRLPCGEEHTTEAYHTNRGPSVYSAQDDSGAVVQQLHDVLFHTPRLASEVNANVPHQIRCATRRICCMPHTGCCMHAILGTCARICGIEKTISHNCSVRSSLAC